MKELLDFRTHLQFQLWMLKDIDFEEWRFQCGKLSIEHYYKALTRLRVKIACAEERIKSIQSNG